MKPSDSNERKVDLILKVYVSSTLLDLKNERDTVINWLTDLRHLPYHSYVGDSESVRDSCLHDIEQCDLYILILGHRYGAASWLSNEEAVSMTHLEFRHAGEKGIPRIALIRESVLNIAPDADGSPESLRLAAFRDEVQRDVRAAIFTDPASLVHQLSTSFSNEVKKLPQATQSTDTSQGAPAARGDVTVKARTIVGAGVVNGGTIVNVNNIKL